MERIVALASGSNGNCYYFENATCAVLIDAGVSCKQIITRMQNLSLDITKVKGLFITHEHSDHICGVNVLCKKYRIPLYITEKTYHSSSLSVDEDLLRFIQPDQDIILQDIRLHAFSKFHDAAEPCSYAICSNGKKVAVLTDIGEPCERVINHLKDSDAVFLETNYDEKMLDEGSYPYPLKQRVKGRHGHLSNYQAALLLLEHASVRLKHVFLSHLSANNNTPEKAFETVVTYLNERTDLTVETILTDRTKESVLVTLD